MFVCVYVYVCIPTLTHSSPFLQEECFVYRDEDLVGLGGASQLMSVYEYIRTRWEGTRPDLGEALLGAGVQMNDFFAHDFNDKDRGLMVAEYVPIDFPDLPRGMPDRSSMDKMGMRTDQNEFAAFLPQAPCVKLEDVQSLLPECLPERDGPVLLEEQHCTDAYNQALGDVESYGERIEADPIKSTRYRWPEDKTKYCVWDCGNYWDGYDESVHVGMDESVKKEFGDNLATWLDGCLQHAAERKYFLTQANATSVRNAMVAGRRKQYFQEVCGQYIDESLKYFKDDPGAKVGMAIGMALLTVVTAGAGTAVVAVGAAVKVAVDISLRVAIHVTGANSGNDGVDKYFKSIFVDDTAKHVTDRDYRYDVVFAAFGMHVYVCVRVCAHTCTLVSDARGSRCGPRATLWWTGCESRCRTTTSRS